MDQAERVPSVTKKRPLQEYSVHGVRLKHFEQVLTRILPSITPEYVQIPPVPKSTYSEKEGNELWPFDQIPASARVLGDNPGQLSKPHRARRKEQQLQSMMRCIFQLLPTSTKTVNDPPFTIIDFGGGSGHLAIPLALLLPECRVVVVDLNPHSLTLLHQKARLVAGDIQKSCAPRCQNTNTLSHNHFLKDPRIKCCGENGVLENLFSFEGPVEEYTESFDMALALHLCGQATDVAIRRSISVGATALVMAPCCVGKLSRQVLNPDIYHATGQNVPTVSYPQSPTFCRLISDANDWDALAKAADYSNEKEARTARNATRRTAKAVLETDRRMFLESSGYRTVLTRMDPWEATPKNDIIVAWNPAKISPDILVFSVLNKDSQADMQVVRSQLLEPTSGDVQPADSSDWTQEEDEEIQKEILDFLERTKLCSDKMQQVLTFPTRMGARKRKLIHFVAQRFDLAHWSVGDKDSEKTVAVSRRGQNRT